MNIISFGKLMRPSHYIKNILVFTPLLLSEYSGNIVVHTTFVFLIFCLAASAVYAFNDLHDTEHDAIHPTKKMRPIPSGEISKQGAFILSVGLTFLSLSSAFMLNVEVFIYVSLYITINILYTLWLKTIPIIDIILVSSGFVFRFLAGALYLNSDIKLEVSGGIFCICMSLAIGKRLVKLNTAGGIINGELLRMPIVYTRGVLLGMMITSSYFAMISASFYYYETLSDHNYSLYCVVVQICVTVILLSRLIFQMAFNNYEPNQIFTSDQFTHICIVVLIIVFIVSKLFAGSF